MIDDISTRRPRQIFGSASVLFQLDVIHFAISPSPNVQKPPLHVGIEVAHVRIEVTHVRI